MVEILNYEEYKEKENRLKEVLQVDFENWFIMHYDNVMAMLQGFKKNDILILDHQDKKCYEVPLLQFFYEIYWNHILNESAEEDGFDAEKVKQETRDLSIEKVILILDDAGYTVVDQACLIGRDSLFPSYNNWKSFIHYTYEKREEKWEKEWGDPEALQEKLKVYLKDKAAGKEKDRFF